MTSKRISWIDFTKAAALLTVIFVHSTPRDDLTAVLTGFVLPVFFILYGVAHNSEKHRDNLRHYITGRFRSLMIPYFILTTAMVFLYLAVYPQVDVGLTPSNFVFWSLYGNGPPGRVTHLWFLRTMFFALLLFSLIDRYLHDRPPLLRYLILILSPALGVWLRVAFGVNLIPWSVDSILVALSFMMVGQEIRRHNHTRSWSISPAFDAVSVGAALTLFVSVALLNGYVNIGESIYGHSVYAYVLTGVVGTYVVGVISYYVCTKSPRLCALAARFNEFGQEVYEIHPLIIQTNIELFGGLAIWQYLTVYPGAPLFLLNFPLAILLSWILASRVIVRSGVLQFAFRGWRVKGKPPEPSFSEVENNGNNSVS